MLPPILPAFDLSLELIAEYDLATTVLSQAYKSPSMSCPFFQPFHFNPYIYLVSSIALECFGLLPSPASPS
jgi:hypothetical protein